MLDDLDDPTPDLQPARTLPTVVARGRALRRRRLTALAGGGVTTAALAVAAVLVLPLGGDGTTVLVPASPTPAVSTSAPAPSTVQPPLEPLPGTATPTAPAAVVVPPSAPAATAVPPPAPVRTPSRAPVPPAPAATRTTPPPPPPSPSPTAAGRLELRGDDLGVTRIGAPRAQAVAAVTAVLGPPTADPSATTSCVDAAEEVWWAGFRLAFDASGRLSGWTSQSPALRTPAGVAPGTTVARLRAVYGDRLEVLPASPDSGTTYVVRGVSMLGSLTGDSPTDTVVALSNGDCTGP